MKKLEIDENKAKELYKTASNELKVIFEDTFGKEFFIEKITNRIKTWEDVVQEYKNKGYGNISLPYQGEDLELSKQKISINSLYKIQCIARILNSEWEEDWDNRFQHKYQPYFQKTVTGWVVDAWVSGFYGTFGPYYKSKELALYAGNQFLDIYTNYLPD